MWVTEFRYDRGAAAVLTRLFVREGVGAAAIIWAHDTALSAVQDQAFAFQEPAEQALQGRGLVHERAGLGHARDGGGGVGGAAPETEVVHGAGGGPKRGP